MYGFCNVCGVCMYGLCNVCSVCTCGLYNVCVCVCVCVSVNFGMCGCFGNVYVVRVFTVFCIV
jgi:hypothetical protein